MLLIQFYLLMCITYFVFVSVQSAHPDWLWSGVGFRLDDRVYREDGVTHILRHIDVYWQCWPPALFRHTFPLSILFLPSLLLILSFWFLLVLYLLWHKWESSSIPWVLLTCLPLGPVWAGWAGWNRRVPGVGPVGAPHPPAPARQTQRPVSWCLKTTGDRWAGDTEFWLIFYCHNEIDVNWVHRL